VPSPSLVILPNPSDALSSHPAHPAHESQDRENCQEAESLHLAAFLFDVPPPTWDR